MARRCSAIEPLLHICCESATSCRPLVLMRRGSNLQPAVLETAALPLSYACIQRAVEARPHAWTIVVTRAGLRARLDCSLFFFAIHFLLVRCAECCGLPALFLFCSVMLLLCRPPQHSACIYAMHGAPGRVRTCASPIKSRLLFLLSYRGLYLALLIRKAAWLSHRRLCERYARTLSYLAITSQLKPRAMIRPGLPASLAAGRRGVGMQLSYTGCGRSIGHVHGALSGLHVLFGRLWPL